MFKQVFLPLIAVFVFITLVGLLYQGKLNFLIKTSSPSLVAETKSIKINGAEINVEIAKSQDERSKGLSGRDELDKNSGMLFVFPKNSKPVFWMKDTKISLDIIWINDDKIVGIEKNVPTELNKPDSDLKKYQSPSEVDYVLEVNAGFCDNKNIKVGQTISGLEQLQDQ